MARRRAKSQKRSDVMSQKFFASVLLLFSWFVLGCHSERSEEPLYFVVVVACFSVVYRNWRSRPA
jgi:hypothetical protein